MAVLGYIRASTDKQEETLKAQRADITRWALMERLVGHEDQIEFVIDEGVSGATPFAERPEGGRLLRRIKKGDIIITTKLDRCFRSARDALNVVEDLKQDGVGLHMIDLKGDVTSNGISSFFFTIMSAVAQQERERIRERIVDVKRDQKRRNRFLGGNVPFGCTTVETGEITPHGAPVRVIEATEERQAAIDEMRALQAGGMSLRAIADHMTAKGFKISHAGVRKVLALVGVQSLGSPAGAEAEAGEPEAGRSARAR